MTRLALLCLAVLSCIPSPAAACLWDSDTLAQEAKGLPGVVEALVGFYPQNPPRFYEMRLERVLPLIEADPTALALYDDASVAYDKLGNTDAAIAMMAQKRTALDAYPEDDPLRIEHEYRYLANLGTHHAHRWLASENREEDLTDLERARDLIAAAIELNPDAHFGREFVQLRLIEAFIEWDHIHNEPSNNNTEQPRYWHAIDLLVAPTDDETTRERLLEGYIGLVILGQGAQSIDVHSAIGRLADRGNAATLVHVAKLRIDELYRDGSRSIFMPEVHARLDYLSFGLSAAESDIAEQTERYFAYARLLAVQQQEHREWYMSNRLSRGQHPDTHTEFWEDYESRSLPRFPNGFLGLGISLYSLETLVVISGLLLVGFLVAIYAIGRWRRRRKHQRAAAAA